MPLRFWKALRSEQQFTEDINNKTAQVKKIKLDQELKNWF